MIKKLRYLFLIFVIGSHALVQAQSSTPDGYSSLLDFSPEEEEAISEYKRSQKYLITTVDNMPGLTADSKWSVLINANKRLKNKAPDVSFEDQFLDNLKEVDAMQLSDAEKFKHLQEMQAEIARKERQLRDEALAVLEQLNATTDDKTVEETIEAPIVSTDQTERIDSSSVSEQTIIAAEESEEDLDLEAQNLEASQVSTPANIESTLFASEALPEDSIDMSIEPISTDTPESPQESVLEPERNTAEAATAIASIGSAVSANNLEEKVADIAAVVKESNADAAPGLNLRDSAYKQILAAKDSQGFTATHSSANSVAESDVDAGSRVKNSEENENGGLKYRRSSLYTLMINDESRKHFGHIKNTFGNIELSDKFNDHNIGPYLIPGAGGTDDQTETINYFFNQQDIAKQLVARWFNRDANGYFDMNSIAERGSYNASDLDLKIAQDSKRGQALLEDAGEELLKNTFIIVYDYKYTNKEEKAKKTGGLLSKLSVAASFVPGLENVSTVIDGVNLAQTAVGKGYFVKTTAYLYQLDWNEEVASRFYNEMWVDENNADESKKAAFENTDIFKLKFIGTQVARKNLQSTVFSSKSNEDLIGIATVRAADKSISQLQTEFEEFRVKTPLLSGDPITAKIGLKEDLEKGDKFEVLEQVLNEDGRTEYKRVGIIKVDHKQIWDNRFLADEDASANTSGYTVFKGASNKYFSGMLIRQIN